MRPRKSNHKKQIHIDRIECIPCLFLAAFAFAKNEPKEVVQVIDTILGYIKTLEQTYSKAHATATVKDTKKNK